MIESMMSQAATVVNGRLEGDDSQFCGVSIDTRTLQPAELFVALKGPNFDGADFVGKAAERGAAGALCEKGVSNALPTIVVDDSHAALAQLAANWRDRMSATVIGVTGSNGKTTLKELINACLSGVARTLATHGNLNNEIGLPLMLLRLAPQHRFAIFEMGANHAGEIAFLTSLAKPHIVVISNAGAAHLEGFGSLDGVAAAKGEILQGTPRPQAAVLNADDAYFRKWQAMVRDCDVLSFGFSSGATVRPDKVRTTEGGSTFELHLPEACVEVNLPLPGRHNVLNAAAAAAVALAAGLDARKIQRGLQNVRPMAGRLRRLPGIKQAVLYDDSYNANPGSVIAAARFVAAQQGPAWFVLGDMRELGDDEVRLHRIVGSEMRKAGVDRLFAIGELTKHAADAFGDGAEWFASADALQQRLRDTLAPGTHVLVKGSRSMRMEQLVSALHDADAEEES